MNNEKITAPFYEATRNALIILTIAVFRVVFVVLNDKKPVEWSKEYINITLAWAIFILGICFGHAYLGSVIGRVKSGIVVGAVVAVSIAIYMIRSLS